MKMVCDSGASVGDWVGGAWFWGSMKVMSKTLLACGALAGLVGLGAIGGGRAAAGEVVSLVVESIRSSSCKVARTSKRPLR